MRCQECGFENPSDTRYCGRCGRGLVRTCPSCGAVNPEGFAFCGTCGTKLAISEAPAVAPVEERKVVTVLFADVTDSTPLTERLDPEQTRTIMSRFFDVMSAVIVRYGGTLEKFIGDEIMAVFGLPVAHEDDPARAVQAASEMHARLQQLDEDLQRSVGASLKIRIGINTGEVVANPRAAAKGEFMVTGDAVNVAARLRSAAAPGSTVVGSRTYHDTVWLAEYHACPPFTLKGKSVPIEAWEFVRLIPDPAPRVRGGLRAPLIGRADEAALLGGLLARVLKERKPYLATVLGMPGVGKSRLLEELIGSLPPGVIARHGRSLPYASTALWELGQVIRSDCGISHGDPAPVVTAKLRQRLAEVFDDNVATGEAQEITAQLARVLALRAGETDPASGVSRESLFWAVRRYLERVAGHQPVMLAFEDLHWADPDLLDLIEYLAQWVNGPLFIVGLARPELLETRPGWGGGKRNYTALFLEPLKDPETRTLLQELLRVESLPAPVLTSVSVAEGNPFFIEEILRMMIDSGILRRTNGAWELHAGSSFRIPDTVQGVITARLDGLPGEEKAVLLEASVVGKVFWTGAVAHLAARDEPTLRPVLAVLESKDLLLFRDPSQLSGQREYEFKHALIRDVAYGLLPKSRRAQKHREFAVWLSQTVGDRQEEYAEILAHHWALASQLLQEIGSTDNWAEVAGMALQFALMAGRKAARAFINDQAIAYFRTAKDLADQLGADSERIAAIEGLADVHALQAQWEAASPLYQEALDYHLRRGDSVRQARVQSRIGSTFSGVFDFRGALPHIQSAMQALEQHHDEREIAGVYLQMARTQTAMGNFADAEDNVRKGLELAGRHSLASQMADGEWTLGFISSLLGRADALTHYARCIELAAEHHDLHWAITAYSWRAWRHRIHGDYALALADYAHALRLAEDTNNRPRMAFCFYGMGMTNFLQGSWLDAADFWKRYLTMSDEVPSWRQQTRSNLAFLEGNLDAAVDWAHRAIAQAERRREVSSMGVARDWTAFLLLRLGRCEAALQVASEGIGQFQPMGVFWPAYLHPLAAEAALELGDLDAASAHARDAEAYLPLDIKVAKARLLRVQGALASAGAAPEDAVARAKSAVELCQQFGNAYELAISHDILARMLRRHGEALAAAAEFQQAAQTYQRLGAAFELARVSEARPP